MAGFLAAVALVAALAAGGATVPLGGDAMKLALDFGEAPAALALSAFVAERARESFKVQVVEGECDAGAAQGRCFEVRAELLGSGRARIGIHQGGVVLASRVVSAGSSDALKLTVWLLVRSTIRRTLLEGSSWPAPHEEDVLDFGVLADAADHATAGEPARAAAAAGGDADQVRAPAPAAEPAPPAPEQPAAAEVPAWGALAFAAVSVSSPRLFAVGPSAGLWVRPWRGLVGGAEIGYRISPGVEGLTRHQAPASLLAGWLVLDPELSVGLHATVELEAASAGRRRDTALGAVVGGHAELHAPFAIAGAELLVRAAFGMAILRHRYLLDSGAVTEQPWTAAVATGVTWR